MIEYIDSAAAIQPQNLVGFFVGWPNPPSPETHLELLKNSNKIVLAIDRGSNRVVGFITAITDRVLSAYIPLLEVLPEYQGQGIGKQLVQRMLASLDEFYMVDLLCDRPLQVFYSQFDMLPSSGMLLRRYEFQSGKITSAL